MKKGKLKVYLEQQYYEQHFGEWDEKITLKYLTHLQNALESDGTVSISFKTYTQILEKEFDELLSLTSVIFVNKFGFTNFAINNEAKNDKNSDEESEILFFPIDVETSQFEYIGKKEFTNNKFSISASDTLLAVAIQLSQWDGEIEIESSYQNQLIASFINHWANEFGVQIKYDHKLFNKLSKTNDNFEEFLKVKYQSEKIEYRSFEIYKDPSQSRDKIQVSQEEIISSIIENVKLASNGAKYSDHFITAPTGTGKSIMFQTPAYHIAVKYKLLTIVVSPLKALMKDQVDQFRKTYDKVATINSDINFIERTEIIKKITSGEINIVYVSPETLLANSYNNIFGERKLGLLVIDEAHIVTTWGHGFRPDYWYLDKWISKVRKSIGNFSIATFTATASYSSYNPSAMNKETISGLSMKRVIEVIAPAYRKDIVWNLNYIEKSMNEENYSNYKAEKIFNTVKMDKRKTLIYFPYKSQVPKVGRVLFEKGIEYATYTGGMDKYQKNDGFQKFVDGEVRIMLATKAFGMGIDIPDIERVIHFAPTGGLADYLQEVGRAARDKKLQGIAVMDSVLPGSGQKGYSDFRFIDQLHGMSVIRKYELSKIASAIFNEWEKTKKQNLLMPMDAFMVPGTNLDNDSEQENRVKTAFVMLQKDLEIKRKYPPIVIRPTMLLTEVLVENIDYEVTSEFDKYVSKTNSSLLSLNLEKVWEEKFSDRTFPEFKFMYFAPKSQLRHMKDEKGKAKYSEKDLELLFKLKNKYNPRQLIEFEEFSKEAVISKINRSASIGKNIIQALKERSIEFKKGDIRVVSHQLGLEFSLVEEFINALINYDALIAQTSARTGTFLWKTIIKKKMNTESYVISESGDIVETAQSRLIYAINRYMIDTKLIIPIQLSDDHIYKKTMYELRLFEMLGQLNFEIKSGDKPKVFVRINYAPALKDVLKEDYKNAFIVAAKKRHESEKKIFLEFLTNEFEPNEREKFVEDYFLMSSERSDD